MKKSKLSIILFSLVLLCSCKTTAVVVPGQTKVILKNIYIEYMALADEYYNLEKYSKAATYYQQCLSDKSLYNTAYYKLGLCYVKTSDWNNAEQVYSKLLKKDPDNSTLKSSLAYIQSMNGNTKDSVKLYGQLVIDYPEVSEYLENYIALLIQTEDLENAETQFNILKEKFPDSKKISLIDEKLKKQTEEQPAENEDSNETAEEETSATAAVDSK